MDVFYSWPPVTRTLIAATVATSLAVHGGFLPVVHVAYIPARIFTLRRLPEIWRLVAPFLLTGPKFGLLMDPYFMYTYASQLERGSPRFTEPGSFAVYLAFVMGVILALGGHVLSGFFFLQPLILAFSYTFSQDQPNSNVTIYILTFPAKFLPYALIALTFVMDGPGSAKLQLSGLLAAHAYDFLTRIWPTFGGGRNYLKTPEVIKGWFAGAGPTVESRGFGTAIRPGAQQRDTGTATGNWNRGPGRRLGG